MIAFFMLGSLYINKIAYCSPRHRKPERNRQSKFLIPCVFGDYLFSAGGNRDNLDSHDVFVDDELTTIVAAFAANCVIDVPSAAVRADSESRDESFVVCATFRGSGVRLSAFRMCHCSIVF